MRGRFAALRSLTLPYGAPANTPSTTIGASPIPAELVAFYAGPPGSPEAVTTPETVVSVDLYRDGLGNYGYSGYVRDSTAPTPLLCQVVGSYIGGTVTEYYRVVLNPDTSPAGTQTAFYNNQIFAESNNTTTDVFTAGLSTDTLGRLIIEASGRLFLGPGGASLTDLLIARTAIATLNIATDPGGSSPAAIAVLNVAGNQVLPSNMAIGNLTPAGSITINTTGFSDVTGISQAHTKIYASTRVKVRIKGCGFVSAVDNVFLGVRVNGADTQLTPYRFNAINDHRTFEGTIALPAFAAGVYTYQARLKVATGTTTFTTGSSVDGWDIEVEEIV